MNDKNIDGILYKLGDIFTLPGRYKRRTFLQWLKKHPRHLQQYEVIANNGTFSEYEEV